MFFEKTDVKERVAEIKLTTLEIQKKIGEFRTLHNAESKFLACNKLEGALNMLEKTTENITSSRHLSKNIKDEPYRGAMRSLQVATLNLEDALVDASYCKDLAPMS